MTDLNPPEFTLQLEQHHWDAVGELAKIDKLLAEETDPKQRVLLRIRAAPHYSTLAAECFTQMYEWQQWVIRAPERRRAENEALFGNAQVRRTRDGD